MAVIRVDRKACIRCGACIDVCFAAQVFELSEEGVSAARPDACWGCGQCVAVCPTDAIDHDRFPLEECPLIARDAAPSLEALTAALRTRRSCRTFEDKPVPRDIVRELVSLGRWAPSASNRQSIDWTAFDDREKLTELTGVVLSELARLARLAAHPLLRPFVALRFGRKAAGQARRYRLTAERLLRRGGAGDDPIFYRAPVVLVAHSPADSWLGRDDAVYASYNLMLAAEQHGLATCQIGFLQLAYDRSERVRRLVRLPEGRVSQVALAVGYPRRAFRRMLPRRLPNLTWNPR